MQFLSILNSHLSRNPSKTLEQLAWRLDRAVRKQFDDECWIDFANLAGKDSPGINNGQPHLWICAEDGYSASHKTVVSFTTDKMIELGMSR